MKIAVIGYSGSGKSTLARRLGEYCGAEVLHIDTLQFLPGWQVRDDAEKLRLMRDFLDAHDAWVIDGNYSKLCFERRMAEADRIVLMLFGRFDCLRRVARRYRRYRHSTRPDMTEGCDEKLDWAFVKWVLWEGRGRRARARYAGVVGRYPDKVIVLRNQRQLDTFVSRLHTDLPRQGR